MSALLVTLAMLLASGTLHIEPVAPYTGALGLACDVRFEGVPGNVQHRCPGPGVVLYPAAFRDEQTLQNVLYHELRHLEMGVDGPAGDPFNERARYREACGVYPIEECERWQR